MMVESMPVVLTRALVESPVEPPRNKFTRGERRRLDATGLFKLNRFELIDGDFYGKNGLATAFVED
jgi:hypothetical protein